MITLRKKWIFLNCYTAIILAIVFEKCKSPNLFWLNLLANLCFNDIVFLLSMHTCIVAYLSNLSMSFFKNSFIMFNCMWQLVIPVNFSRCWHVHFHKVHCHQHNSCFFITYITISAFFKQELYNFIISVFTWHIEGT